MFRSILVSALVLLSVTPAGAAPTVATFSLKGTEYVAVVDDDSASVLADPARAELSLPPLAAGPDCATVNRTLAPFERIAAACKAGATSPTCGILQELINRVRVDQGPVGQRRLAQAWRVGALASPFIEAEAVRDAATLATGARRVELVATPQPTGLAREPRVVIKDGGTSWASIVNGWLDWTRPAAVFDRATGSWVTNDNLLACGIIAGEVELAWEQPVELSPRGSPLSAADLVQLYSQLQTAEPLADGTAEQRFFSLGIQVGTALQGIGVSPTEAQAAGRFAFAHLFAADLSLLPLTEGQLRALATANVIRPLVSWTAAIRK